MDITVVVCTYNRSESLAATLTALALQNVGDLTWELIVVDNNSRDNTREIVDGFARNVLFPVRYRFEGRQGLCHARNAGIASARGEIVAFTDDDVRPEENWVSNTVFAMRQWNADAIGGQIWPRWEKDPPDWLARNQDLQNFLALTAFSKTQVLKLPLKAHPQIWGANMAFRHSYFGKVGLFDINRGPIGVKTYQGDDVDLIRRGLEKGLNAVFDPRLIVWHHVPRERMQRSYFRKRCFYPGEAAGMRFESDGKRQILGIPGWAYVHLISSIGLWLRALISRGTDSFAKELDLMEKLGFMWGCAKRYNHRMRGPNIASTHGD